MPQTHVLIMAIAAVAVLSGAGAAKTQTLLTGKAGSGKTSGSLEGLYTKKIVGGSSSSIEARPYMVSIGKLQGKSYEQQCGATILDQSHVLTAAHCVLNKNLSLYQLRAGSTSRLLNGQVRSLSKIGVHAKFNNDTYDYDVAVLKLSQPLTLDGKTAKAVSLVPAKTAVKSDTTVVLVGWGFEDAGHSSAMPANLQEVEVSTISNSECSADYLDINAVTDRMFCGMTMSKDSCQGDSGGPVINKATQQQIGIISWALSCAQLGSPGVYTNLADAEIRSFIDSELKS